MGKTVKYNAKDIVTISLAPQDLKFSSIGADQVTLNWSDVSFNEDGFYIYRSSTSQHSDATLIAHLGANIQSFTDISLANNTTYYYTISSYNIAGNNFINNGYLMAVTTTSSPVVPVPPILPPNVICEDFTNFDYFGFFDFDNYAFKIIFLF